jgi:pimeloyl-ACP methyl ester carboxylesterase
MTTEAIGEFELSFDSEGSGAPCLLLVHGGFCNRNDWSAQVRALAPQFRVVSFDMPGHGESRLPAQPTVGALAAALNQIKERHGGGHAVMIGHSLGVDIILEAFRQSPAGVAGLILIEGGLVADGDPDRAARAIEEKMDAVGLDAFLDAAFRQMFTPSSDAVLRETVLARLKNVDRRFAKQIILSKVRWDASLAAPVLRSVNVPVLLIQSTYFDATFQRRSLEPGMTTPWTVLVKQQLPAAELCHIEGGGHFPQIEAAPVVNEQIRAFAERLRNACPL